VVQRRAQIISVLPEQIQAYEELHAATWPEVLATIRDCNIRNYSIYRHDTTLFSYMEYIGDDPIRDRERMAADPATQRWWQLTNAMQRPVEDAAPGEWWKPIPEVFHTD
jgi:L-rhamnose mutarotase